MKPIIRSALRLYMGKKYFRFNRYMKWYFDNVMYAKSKGKETLPFVVFKHQTPLLRKLKDVEMWMQYNKVKNLTLASERLNGIVLQPGETFSYWRLIGHPIRKKGYVEGMILFHGNVVSGIGGGLCQLSNLIYWMTIHTPLTIVERYRHSYDVFPDSNRTQPFGSGATCAYNYLDLQIRNDTDQPYQLNVYVTDANLTGEWRSSTPTIKSYEIYEKKHWITQEYWGGYVRHNEIYRKVYNLQDELVEDEYVSENHAIMMYSPLLSNRNEKTN